MILKETNEHVSVWFHKPKAVIHLSTMYNEKTHLKSEISQSHLPWGQATITQIAAATHAPTEIPVATFESFWLPLCQH